MKRVLVAALAAVLLHEPALAQAQKHRYQEGPTKVGAPNPYATQGGKPNPYATRGGDPNSFSTRGGDPHRRSTKGYDPNGTPGASVNLKPGAAKR